MKTVRNRCGMCGHPVSVNKTIHGGCERRMFKTVKKETEKLGKLADVLNVMEDRAASHGSAHAQEGGKE